MKRTAIQEWVKWQLITAAVFLINGSVYAFKFPYPTLKIFTANPIFISIAGIPLAAIIGLLTAIFILVVETDWVENPIVQMAWPRALLYFAAGLGSLLTLTNAQPASFLIFSALCIGYDAMSDSSELPK